MLGETVITGCEAENQARRAALADWERARQKHAAYKDYLRRKSAYDRYLREKAAYDRANQARQDALRRNSAMSYGYGRQMAALATAARNVARQHSITLPGGFKCLSPQEKEWFQKNCREGRVYLAGLGSDFFYDRPTGGRMFKQARPLPRGAKTIACALKNFSVCPSTPNPIRVPPVTGSAPTAVPPPGPAVPPAPDPGPRPSDPRPCPEAPPPKQEAPPPKKQAMQTSGLVSAGLLLVLVAGAGGAYYYSTRKKAR